MTGAMHNSRYIKCMENNSNAMTTCTVKTEENEKASNQFLRQKKDKIETNLKIRKLQVHEKEKKADSTV